jgi:acetyl esterase/lipase
LTASRCNPDGAAISWEIDAIRQHIGDLVVENPEDAVHWVLSQPEKFDASRLSISGFSAGGTLSLVLSSVVFPQGTFKNVLAAYPPTDMIQGNTEKIAPDTSIDLCARRAVRCFHTMLLRESRDVKSVFASPAVIPAEKFSDRIFLVTAACDRLCLEGETLGNRIRNETTKHVEMYWYEGCEHAFDKAYTKGSVQERAKDDFYERAATFLTV